MLAERLFARWKREFACGIPHLLKGEFTESVGRGIDSPIRQPMVLCGHRALQLSRNGAHVDGSHRHRMWQYLRYETE